LWRGDLGFQKLNAFAAGLKLFFKLRDPLLQFDLLALNSFGSLDQRPKSRNRAQKRMLSHGQTPNIITQL
jgi:hypothetical protein